MFKNLYFGNGSISVTPPLWVSAGSSVITTPVDTAGYSTDGTNWTGSASSTSLIPSGQGFCLVYRNGIWLLGAGSGSTNKVIYSTDSGVTWTASTSANSIFTGTTSVRCLCSNGSVFVAGVIGSSSTALGYSTDGINWTSSSSATTIFGTGTANGVRDVIWDGSKFLACGSGTTATSTDGINWTQGSLSSGGTLNAVCFNGSIYTLGGNAVYYTSTDGSNWTSRTFPFANFAIFNRIRWNGSYFLGLGGFNTGSPLTPTMIRSTDGIAWVAVNSNERILYSAFDASWNGSKWIAVGQMRTVPSAVDAPMVTSTDGITWTAVRDAYTKFGAIQNGIFSLPNPSIYPPIT